MAQGGSGDEKNMPEWAKKLEDWGKKQNQKWNKRPPYERKGDFVASVIVNLIGLYIITHLAGWFPNFFTDGWFAVLSVAVTVTWIQIIAYSILIVFSPKAFYYLAKTVINVAVMVSAIVTISLWPFNMPEGLSIALRLLLGLIIFGIAIGTIVEFFKIFATEKEEK